MARGSSIKDNSKDPNSTYQKLLVYKHDELYKPSTKQFIFVWNDKSNEYVVQEVASETTTHYITTADEKIDKHKAEPKNPSKFDGVEDCAVLGELNEATVLWNLKLRYGSDVFQTSSGLFLVIINPYKRFPIYTDEMVAIYKGKRRNEVAPHVFALADEAYRNMMENKQNQSMLITGESGAGKTENTKKVIQYLTSIAGKEGGTGLLEEQLLKCNPILEAFGNAKTLRNDNSSRFGKFIEVQFNASGYISGAVISTYLLEKSRVTSPAKGERAFHIFYQLLEGASPELKKELHLKSAESFEFLSASGCTSVPSLNDKKEFEDLVNALDTYKIDRDDQEAMWRVVSAIVHLSNLPFIAEGPNNLAALKNKDEINIIGELMEVEPQVLEDAILRPRVKAGGRDVVKTHLDKDKAHDSMEALAKSLHHRLFLWLVKRINKTLCQEMRSTYIGVLDIAGFEIFDFNNFEQLLINYTNERLQQFFNHHMFNLEQEEYEREQIEWTFIDFGMDSEPVINLIEKKPGGLLALLDEECHLGKVERGDTNFLQKLNNHFSKHEKYQAPRFKSEGFQVIHYAGIVEYTTGMWLDKNRDPLADDIVSCLLASENRFISRLFQEGALPIAGAASKAGGARKKGAQFTTVAAQHKEQLLSLMATLNSTYPHFIRCIAEGEAVTMADGTSRRIEDVLPLYEGKDGVKLQSSTVSNGKVVSGVARSSAGIFNHTKECVTITMQDGRTLKCTKDHRLRLADGDWIEAADVVPGETRLAVQAIEAPLDTVTDDEADFALSAGPLELSMATPDARAKTLAFARVLGFVLGDGHVSQTTVEMGVGSSIDLDAVLRDVATIQATQPSVADRSTCFHVKLNGEISAAIRSLDGVLAGARVGQHASLPTFLESAPVAVVREFLAALFGADGWAPVMEKHRQSAATFSHVKFMHVCLADKEHVRAMKGYMKSIVSMLSRVGVDTNGYKIRDYPVSASPSNFGAKVDNRERRQVRLCLANSLSFAETVGFRYCVQKETRLAAACVFWRFADNVLKQRVTVGKAALQARADGDERSWRSLITEAAEELSVEEPLLHPNSAFAGQNPSEKVLKGAVGASRYVMKKMKKSTMLADIGAANWFSSGYVVDRTEIERPTLSLLVAGVREAGVQRVYDLSVPGNEAFFAGSIAVHNCIIPNEKKTPGVIDDKLVLDQLRCNGVLEGIRISRKGFPNRIVYAEFLKRYYLLDPKNKVPRKTGDAKGVTKTLLEAIKMDAARYRYGLTKVFFKAGALAELEEMRERKISELILTVQAACRGWGDRRKFRIMHSEADAALAVQTNIRAWLRFKKWGWWSLFCKARPLLKRRNFEKEVEERERAINELKAQLQRETDERAKLDARAKELQEHLEKLSVDIEDAQEQLRDCNEDKDRLGKAKRDLEDEVDGLRADVDDLESAKEKAKRNASSLDEELDDIKDKLDDETKARARAEEARKLLEADLEKEQAELAAMKAANAEVTAAKAKLARDLSELEDSLASTGDAKAAVDKRRKELEDELEETSAALDDCSAKREKAERDAKKLEADLAALDERFNSTDKSRAALDADHKATSAKLKEAEEQLAEQSDLAKKLGDAKKKLEAELTSTKDELDSALSAKSSLSKAKSSLENEVALLREQLDSEGAEKKDVFDAKRKQELALEEVENKLADANADLEKQTKLSKGLQLELDDMKDQLEAAEASADALQRAKKKLETELEEVEDQLDAESRAKSDLDKSLVKTKAELADARAEIEALSSGKSSTNAQLRAVETQLADVQEALEQERANNESANRAKKALEAQVAELNELLEEESRRGATSEKSRKDATSQLDELKLELEEEREERQKLAGLKTKREAEIEDVNQRLAAETAAKQRALEQARVAQRKLAELEEDMEDLEGGVSSAQKDARRYQAQADELQDQLDAEIKERSKIERIRAKLEDQLNDATSKLETRTIAQNSLELSVKNLQAELDEARETLEMESGGKEALAKKKKALDAQLEEYAEEKETLEIAKNKLEKQRRELERQVEELRDELEGAESAEANEALRRQMDVEMTSANDRVARAEEAKAAADEAKRSFQKQVEELQNSLEDEQKARNKLESQKKRLELEIEDMHAQLDAEAQRKAAIEKDKKALKREMREAVAAATSASAIPTDEFRRLEQDLEDARAALEKEALARAGLDKRRKALEDELDDLKDQLEDEVAAKERLSKSKRSLETELEEVKDQLEEEEEEKLELEEAKRKLQLELDELRKKWESEMEGREKGEDLKLAVEKEVSKLRTAYEEERKAKSELERARRRLETEVDDLTTRYEVLSKEKQKFEKTRRNLERQLKEARGRLEEEEVNKGDSESSVWKLEEEVDALKQQIDQHSKQQAALEKSKMSLEDQVLTLKDQLEEEARSRAKQQQARKDLEAEVEELRDHAEEEEERRLEIEQTKSKVEAEADELRRAVEKERLEKANIEDRLKTLDRENALLKEEVEDKHKQGGNLEIATKRYKAEIDDLTMRVEHEAKNRAKADKARKAAESQVSELRGKLTGLEKSKVGTDTQITRLESDLKKYKDRLADEEKARTDAEGKEKKYASEIASLKEEIVQLNKRNEALGRKMELFVDMVKSEAPTSK